MKLFQAFKTNKKLLSSTIYVNIYHVLWNDKEYTIIITKKSANKHTIIHFIDNTIYWEQIPRFPKLTGKDWGDKIPIYKFNGKVLNTIFVLKGTLLGDEGLDNGIFRSIKRFDENFVNCMTYRHFKKL